MTILRDPVPLPSGNEGRPLHANSTGTRIEFGDPGWVNVRNRGITGDGSTDEAALWQAVIDEAIQILIPPPTSAYRVLSSLVPRTGQTFKGAGFNGGTVRIGSSALTVPVFDCGASAKNRITFEGLKLSGNPNSATSIGIKADNVTYLTVRSCEFDQFGGPAIKQTSGTAGLYEHIFVDNSVMKRDALSDYVGAIDVGGSDSWFDHIESTVAASAIGTGYAAAFVYRGTNGSIQSVVAEISEAGFVLTGNNNRVIGCRSDLNYGHGFIVTGSANDLIGNLSYKNGRAADNTYDGFLFGAIATSNTVALNRVRSLSTDTNWMRHGFNAALSAGVATDESIANHFAENRAESIRGSLYNLSGTDVRSVSGYTGRDFQAGESGGHNTGHLRIGTYHLWVDSTGDLRIKSSAPSTDTDGTVVGTQS